MANFYGNEKTSTVIPIDKSETGNLQDSTLNMDMRCLCILIFHLLLFIEI